jgi:UDP:flavonoid glycosyltransferase YjiC (YdhE family)
MVWVVILIFVGAQAFADDLVLIAPSVNAMRGMLNVCDEFAAQFDVIFNAIKSKRIHCIPVGASWHVSNFVTQLSFCIGSQAIMSTGGHTCIL